MVEPGEHHDRERDGRHAGDGASDAVVRPLARAARRPCSRPGCPAPARASLVFSYATREAWLDQLAEPVPQAYDLCSPHADRTRPPHGWELRDRRPLEDRVAAPAAPAAGPLDEDHTVAVLAAALRAVPDLPVTEEAPASVTEGAASPVLGPDAASSPPGGPSPAIEPSPAIDPPVAATLFDDDPTTSAAAAAPAVRPKPILATRSRLPEPPAGGAPAGDW
jgi:hypothetical protein